MAVPPGLLHPPADLLDLLNPLWKAQGNLGGTVRQREVIIGPDRRLRLTL